MWGWGRSDAQRMESVDEEEAENVSEKVCEAGRRKGMRQSDWDVQKKYFQEDSGSTVSVLWRDQVRAVHTSGNSLQAVGAAASHRGKRVGVELLSPGREKEWARHRFYNSRKI